MATPVLPEGFEVERLGPSLPAGFEIESIPDPAAHPPDPSLRTRQNAIAQAEGRMFRTPGTPDPVIGGMSLAAPVPFTAPVDGAFSIADGVAQTAQPGLREKAGGTSKIIRGAMEVATPTLPFAIAAAPVATLSGLVAGALAQQGAEAGLQAIGVPQEYAELSGDLAGIVGGGAVAHGVPSLRRAVQPGGRFRPLPPEVVEPPTRVEGQLASPAAPENPQSDIRTNLSEEMPRSPQATPPIPAGFVVESAPELAEPILPVRLADTPALPQGSNAVNVAPEQPVPATSSSVRRAPVNDSSEPTPSKTGAPLSSVFVEETRGQSTVDSGSGTAPELNAGDGQQRVKSSSPQAKTESGDTIERSDGVRLLRIPGDSADIVVAVAKNVKGASGFDPVRQPDRHLLQPDKITSQLGSDAWIARLADEGFDPDEVIGYAGFHQGSNQTMRPGMSYVAPEFRRRGIATELYDLARGHFEPAGWTLGEGAQKADGQKFRAAYDARRNREQTGKESSPQVKNEPVVDFEDVDEIEPEPPSIIPEDTRKAIDEQLKRVYRNWWPLGSSEVDMAEELVHLARKRGVPVAKLPEAWQKGRPSIAALAEILDRDPANLVPKLKKYAQENYDKLFGERDERTRSRNVDHSKSDGEEAFWRLIGDTKWRDAAPHQAERVRFAQMTSKEIASLPVRELRDAVRLFDHKAVPSFNDPIGEQKRTMAELIKRWADSPVMEEAPAASTAKSVTRGASQPGDRTSIPVPGEKKSYQARYVLRELADVQPSHNGQSFEPNEGYEFTNDRDYSKAGNAERVTRQAAGFEPAYLLSDNPDAVNGPPIIDMRGNVLGGNSRTMTLQRVYASRAELAQNYREMLEAKAPAYGIDRAAVRNMKQPVLLREVEALDDAQAAITDFNKTGTASLTSSERAIADARRVSGDTLDYLGQRIADEGEDGTLAKVLGGSKGPQIINKLVEDGVITAQEKPQYIDERGVVTAEGKQRITRLVVGRLFETTRDFDNAAPELRNKLERIVGAIARVEDSPEWNILDSVREAIAMLGEARQRGIRNLDDLQAQSSMFGASDRSPQALAIAKTLQQGPRNMAAAFKQYAMDADFAKGGDTLGFIKPPTPAEAFEAAFGNGVSEPELQTHFDGAGLGGAVESFDRLFRGGKADGEPLRDYSALGATKSRYVRNLSQLEEVSPRAHEAAVRAAASRAQAAALIRSAAPAIDKALGGEATSLDFRRALIESRLRGIRDRWQQLAELARRMPADQLTEWITEGPIQVLGELAARNGFEVNPAERAAALSEQGDVAQLRDYLDLTFRRAADRVANVMTPGEYERVTGTDGFNKALPVYKNLIEKQLADNHSSNEGVFSDALGPLDTYIPLVPVTTAEQAATIGKKVPYRKPRNLQNDFATGLAREYDASMETLKNRLSSAFKANDKASLIETLEEEGLLERVYGDQRVPATMVFNGREFKSVMVETRGGRQRVANGKLVYEPAQAAAVPEWLAGELQPILADGRSKPAPGLLKRILNVVNQAALTGPADAIFHSRNLLGTLVANTPFLGGDLASKTIGNTPFTKVFTAITKMATVNPLDEAAARDLGAMAKLGLIPEKYGSETYSQKFAELTGAHLKKPFLSFGPMLYGPKGVDVRARLIMYRTAKAINPDATPMQMYKFVNQLGNYTETLQGSLERSLKSTGLSPFYTAGSTMLRNGVDAWLGIGPKISDAASYRVAQMLSGGAVGLVSAWVATYRAATGKWPWEDERAKLLQIPVSGEQRHSKLGKAIWGSDTGKTGQVNFGFFSPMVARGSRALGIAGGVNTAMAGGSAAQVGLGAVTDVANSAIHPLAGPVVRAASVAVTGKQTFLVRDYQAGGDKFLSAIDRKAPVGSQLFDAAKEINSFYGNVGAATGFGGEVPDEDSLAQKAFVSALQMSGLISGASNPYATRNALRRERNMRRGK